MFEKQHAGLQNPPSYTYQITQIWELLENVGLWASYMWRQYNCQSMITLVTALSEWLGKYSDVSYFLVLLKHKNKNHVPKNH